MSSIPPLSQPTAPGLPRRRFGLTSAALLLAAALPASAATPPPRSPAARALHELFDRHWEDSARDSPEWATFRGDHRYGGRLSDASPAAFAARDARLQRTLDEARALSTEGFSDTDRLSHAVFVYQLEQGLRLQPFDGYRRLSLGSLWGFQGFLAGLMRVSPAARTADAEMILARFAAYPQRVALEIERLRGGLLLGWVSPRPVLQRSLGQLDALLAGELRRSPFFEPFARQGGGFSAAERTALQTRAEAAIREQVLPPMQALRRFIVDEYLPKAPAEGGLWRYPGGVEVYAAVARNSTTTALTPQQLHDMGRRELLRIHEEVRAVMRELRFEGSFAQFVAFANQPQHFHASPQALLDDYRAIAKRIDPELPRLFAELPRAPYGIRPMPDHLGPGAADNYTAPPTDGTQPGWFNANVLGYLRKPKWSLATLVAHETVPGHHLQSARARELGELPAFRRQGGFTAYSEGWALYAETLGLQIGLYEDPLDRFGHLQMQALRAARLVVDTGLHALGWTRQQAIDFMLEQTGDSEVFVSSEVDRYLSQPGQALAYMVGQLKIFEMRDRARAALGERFDLRRFHNALLDGGALPLAVLEREIERWTAAERARPS